MTKAMRAIHQRLSVSLPSAKHLRRLPHGHWKAWRRMLRLLATLTLATFALEAQSFEFASVKRYVSRSSGAHSAPDVIDLYRPGALPRVEYIHANLKSIVMAGYGVGKDQISGPPWISSEYYDIVAKIPSGALWDQVPGMLQNLLIERFRMTLHRETITRKGFALLVDKTGPELAATQPGSKPGLYRGSGYLRFTDCTVTELSRLLSAFMGSPIADRTGIQGNYDITLKVFGTDLRLASSVGGNSMLSVTEALRAVGLKLQPGMVPATNIVIDKADRVPTLD
jgi:uncharacterized protein (TIGR03435 family)